MGWNIVVAPLMTEKRQGDKMNLSKAWHGLFPPMRPHILIGLFSLNSAMVWSDDRVSYLMA